MLFEDSNLPPGCRGVRRPPQFPNPNSVEVGKVISHSELADLIDIVLSTLGLIVSPVTDLF